MHEIKSVNIGDGAHLFTCDTELFKVETLTLLLAFPEDVTNSVEYSLLLSVMKRGCEKYPTLRAINERLDELYTSGVSFRNRKTDALRLIGLGADALKAEYTDGECDPLLETLGVMNEMLFSPLLDENGEFLPAYVESEKKNQIASLDSEINDPRSYAAIRCREATYAPLGIFDTLESTREKTDAASARSLISLYRRIIDSAELLMLYVGERAEDEMKLLVAPTAQRLGELQKNKRKNPLSFENKPIRLPRRKEVQVIRESRDISQTRLEMSFYCDVMRCDEDYPAMLLFNELFGASSTSRLMRSLREERGLCYECSSAYNSSRGTLFVSMGTDLDNCTSARGEILRQIRSIAAGEIEEWELSAAKKSLCNVYATVTDSPFSTERYCLSVLLAGSKPDPDEFSRQIAALTARDVARAASRLSLDTVYILTEREEGESR